MRRFGGFSLIEVLISLVIFSVGLLGLAALQATALKQNSTAWVRSQATQFSYDIADRMRVNLAAARNGDYDSDYPNTAPSCNPSLAPSGTLAQQDLAEWRNLLACWLPAGEGAVARSGNTFTISVRWCDELDKDCTPETAGGDAKLQEFSFETEL
ncbi:type IV pilus modification protein PilV [Magnetovirga frankeli]|uniref:type IV pilus modification protein PilV n=1 Tax=Magnetovirga frankeli TaxID=947516 RepID=UPI001294173B|nr:type IV pilus modification protein PilV [gamma proteobacterium SS-5]